MKITTNGSDRRCCKIGMNNTKDSTEVLFKFVLSNIILINCFLVQFILFIIISTNVQNNFSSISIQLLKSSSLILYFY